MHNFYLVQWLITLFGYTLPTDVVHVVWTYLFTQQVDFLFYICLGILKHLRPTLLSLDLNQTLAMINDLKQLITSPSDIVSDAVLWYSQTPPCFISQELIAPTDDLEALRQNEFFAKRWWELARLDYSKDVCVCLITLEELLRLEQRLVVDCRDFKLY